MEDRKNKSIFNHPSSTPTFNLLSSIVKYMNYKNGFTLVELLVALGILGLVAVAVNNLFFTTMKVGKKTDIHVKLKEDGAYALNYMATKIRNAKEVVIIPSCGGVNIQIKDNDDSMLFFELSSNRIRSRVVGVDTNFLTGADFTASGLNFFCDLGSPIMVTISFDLTQPDTGETERFQTRVSLRNY